MRRGADAGSGAAYQAAVRVVMGELFRRCAAIRGLEAPAGVLAVDGPAPDPDLVAELLEGVERFDLTDLDQLGYAYESLLAHEDRKHAGAHYTPRTLADEVVEHALAPLVAGRGSEELLDLRIVDIAAGSGVFLVAAAEYLARLHPGRPALRDIVTRCLYGADVNATTVEICRLTLWLLAGDPDLPLTAFDERIRHGDSLVEVEGVADRIPVDWSVHAPEVMAAGGFDAVVGNPPFLGVKNIRGAIGQEVRDHYAATLLGGQSGRSDLVVFFVAQATRLARGTVGLVVPDAIAEGDSARFGLGRALERGFRLYRAETSRPWPSEAGVRIALVWLQAADADPVPCVLDDHDVEAIGPGLGRVAVRQPVASTGGPPAWMPHGYQATIVLGKSLVLSREEADALAVDPRVTPWVKEYLSGEDLVSTVGPRSTRCVLDLGGEDLATLESVPALADVLAAVRRERDAQLTKYPQLRARWWGFLNRVDRLYDAIGGQSEVIALSKHAKYVWPVLVATGPVFSNGTIVYPSADRALYAFLASTPHRLWAVDEGGSRLNQSIRYNPSRLLRTYPFPDSVASASDAGHALADAVAHAQAALGVGVTDLLNQVHREGAEPVEVARVRDAWVEADRAVLGAHGISARVDYGFRNDGERSWFGPDAAGESAIKAHLLR